MVKNKIKPLSQLESISTTNHLNETLKLTFVQIISQISRNNYCSPVMKLGACTVKEKEEKEGEHGGTLHIIATNTK